MVLTSSTLLSSTKMASFVTVRVRVNWGWRVEVETGSSRLLLVVMIFPSAE